jgi:hypothetical protein
LCRSRLTGQSCPESNAIPLSKPHVLEIPAGRATKSLMTDSLKRVTDMQPAWKTKYGGRRVRHDPPTIEEALEAAQCLTDDPAAQIEVAASLIGLPIEDVRAVALRAQRRTTIQRVAPAQPSASGRAVIVERRTTRRRIAAP